MKKVSVNKWKKLLPKPDPVEHNVALHFVGSEETLDIVVLSDLTIENRMAFAKDVVESCFDIKDGTYIPYAFDISLAINLVQYFTNIEVGEDTKLAFDLVQNTDVITAIKNTVSENKMDRIEAEVYELLQWQKAKRMQSTKTEELYDALTMLVNSFSAMANSAKTTLDEGAITTMIDFMSKHSDPESLAKAVLSARKEIE